MTKLTNDDYTQLAQIVLAGLAKLLHDSYPDSQPADVPIVASIAVPIAVAKACFAHGQSLETAQRLVRELGTQISSPQAEAVVKTIMEVGERATKEIFGG